MTEKRRRLAVAGLCLAVLVSSCTNATDSTTTTGRPEAVSTTSTPASAPTTEDPQLAVALPTDPAVVVGELDNGLTYYLRENDSPGGRVELRLLVDAGSIQEDPDQAGMAHFLEHMMFNGTERFPKNELIAILESFGPRFGPDINAYTSFDETVYELSLTTDTDELMQLGVDVLREWASRATLTETDVVEERGVILDEWRLRAQGFGARINEQFNELILPGSAYQGHLPIGTADSIRSTIPELLRRFYEDWYRPGRMGIVAVGDFDLDEMEARIVDAFADIDPVDSPRSWEPVNYEAPNEPRVSSHRDEEATSGAVSVVWPVPANPIETVGDYQTSVTTSLGLGILGSRLSDDALAGNSPLLDASVIDFAWTRTIGLRGVDTTVRAGSVDDGLQGVLSEIERIRRDGITDAEFDRAITGFTTASRQLLDQEDSIQDVQLAAQITAHHLAGQPLMDAEQRFDVETGIVERLSKQDIEDALVALMGGAPAVLVLGPDDEGLEMPGEGRILEILESLGSATLDSREQLDTDEIELMEVPDPAAIANKTVDSRFGHTTLEFENGARVYLWESDIARQSVLALIEGFGGTSHVAVEDLPEAFLTTEIVARSGIGEIDIPTLRRLFADRIVSVQPWISETRQGLEASASTNDVETLFQLIHLTMTEPRFDQTAVDAVLDEMRSIIASSEDLPGVLFEEAISEAYYGDDPRYFVVPSAEQIETFDVSAAESVFRQGFANARDFAFAFVGDFDTDTMIDLAARYVGTLPGGEEPAGFVDHQPLPPRRVQVTTVEAGADEQGQIGMFFTNPFQPELRDRVTASVLELIVTARLRTRVREELSATYSISASIDLQRDPDPFAEASVTSTGDPAGLDQISAEIVADLAELQRDGPTESQFDTAVEQLRDALDLIDNRVIAETLVTAHLYPDQPVTELAERSRLVDEITPTEVTSLANTMFNQSQRIEVRQVPRS